MDPSFFGHDKVAARNKLNGVEQLIALSGAKSMEDANKDQQADRNNRLLETGSVDLDRADLAMLNALTGGRREDIIHSKEFFQFETRDDDEIEINDDDDILFNHTSRVGENNGSDFVMPYVGTEDLTFRKQIEDLCREFEDIFSMESRPDPADIQPMRIQLKVDDNGFDLWRHPRNRQTCRLQSPAKQKAVLQQVNQMVVDSGVIRPRYSIEYSQVLMRPKPDGSFRFCVDYRSLMTVAISSQVGRFRTSLL